MHRNSRFDAVYPRSTRTDGRMSSALPQLLGPALASLLLLTPLRTPPGPPALPSLVRDTTACRAGLGPPTTKGTSGDSERSARPRPSPGPAWTACGVGAKVSLRGQAVTQACSWALRGRGRSAASSQDRPPTRHIRTAGLSPGPARLWPLALTRNTQPYGLPQGG